MPVSELESELCTAGSGAPLPTELPLAHLTAARWLQSIVDAGYLRPHMCKIFSQELLYFSYGGVFYRTSKLQTEKVTELPVAMVFEPPVMDLCSTLFPFDSGAMAQKLFGAYWHEQMKPFQERYAVRNNLSGAAQLLVQTLFLTNENYIRGDPADVSGPLPSALDLLHNFLKQDLSGLRSAPSGIDHRQRSIELLSTVAVSIAKHLVWIGLPHTKIAQTIAALRKLTRTIPQVYTYHYTRNFNPDEYAGRLQEAAEKELIGRYLR